MKNEQSKHVSLTTLVNEVQNDSLNGAHSDENYNQYTLEQIIERYKKQDFNATAVVYIDDDIKQILTLLKTRHNFKMGSFLSMLIYDFIQHNKEEVLESLTINNKFL